MKTRQIQEQVRRAWAITKKDIRIYYYKSPVIISGVLMPVFLYLAFLMGNKAVSIPLLISGLIGMTLFFTATAVSPVIFPWEGQARTLERLISSPVALESIILGDLIASSLFGIAITMIALFIGLIFGAVVIHGVILIVSIILGALCFSAIGILLSAPPTAVPQNIMLLSTLVKFPLLFISGVFIPIEQMPGIGQVIALFSPLTYFTDIARYSYTNVSYFPVILDAGILLLWTVLLIVGVVFLHKKTIPKRI